MHVGKPSGQRSLTSNMHGRRSYEILQPAAADVMYPCQIVENASFALVNFYGFLFFFRVLAHGPLSRIPVKDILPIPKISSDKILVGGNPTVGLGDCLLLYPLP